jgi:hypothetical protein
MNEVNLLLLGKLALLLFVASDNNQLFQAKIKIINNFTI